MKSSVRRHALDTRRMPIVRDADYLRGCDYTTAACSSDTLLRSVAIADATVDTVTFPNERAAASTSNAAHEDRVRDGVCVCYSGQLRGFGGRNALLSNHMSVLLKPLVKLFGANALHILFSTTADEALPNKVLRQLERAGINNTAHEPRPAANTSAAGAWLAPQFIGIEHCGRLISKAAATRGRPFQFAVRMRFDLLLHRNSHVESWPIWRSASASPILTLGKYLTENLTRTGLELSNCPWQLPTRRCVPQDAFFVVRYATALGEVESIFLEGHRRTRRWKSKGLRGFRDQPERITYHLPLAAGVPFDIVWLHEGFCMWKLFSPRALFSRRCPNHTKPDERPPVFLAREGWREKAARVAAKARGG